MYLTHGSRAGSVEGFGDRDGRRGARGTQDHREVRGIGDSSESLVGSDPGDIAGKQQPRTCRADAPPHDGRRPGRGQEGAGCQRRFPVITARSMDCSSEPGVIVAGAGALPRARRRCEAGKRTHGPGTRACLALLAATALLAMAAPAQAQTEIWSATFTPANFGSGFIGCSNENDETTQACSTATVLSDDDFTHDSTDYSVISLFLSGGTLTLVLDTDITTATAALTLVVGTTSLALADATTITNRFRTWSSPGLSWTVGTAIDVKLTAAASTNTAPTVANAIQDQTATAGTAFSYAFLANTFADTDTGDTLTYTATQSDDTALPSWLSFAAATRTFSGTPPAADVGTVSVKVTASDGNGGSVSDTFDIVVSAAANTLATGAPTITGTAQVGQTLTAGTTAIMDADGLTSVSYTYQWIVVATDNTETNISSATASTYTLVAADQGTTVKVTVSFTDDANNPETRTSAATAAVSAAPNTPATGAPTITGTAQVGQTLTAGTTAIMDADGLTTPNYTYQWIRVARARPRRHHHADGRDREPDPRRAGAAATANSSTYPLVLVYDGAPTDGRVYGDGDGQRTRQGRYTAG